MLFSLSNQQVKLVTKYQNDKFQKNEPKHLVICRSMSKSSLPLKKRKRKFTWLWISARLLSKSLSPFSSVFCSKETNSVPSSEILGPIISAISGLLCSKAFPVSVTFSSLSLLERISLRKASCLVHLLWIVLADL